MELRRNGAVIVEDISAPYAAAHMVASSLAIGDALRFEARAFDFAGNATDAQPVCAAVIPSGDGLESSPPLS